jgi:hypothetical protein
MLVAPPWGASGAGLGMGGRMNDDIIRMAREAGFIINDDNPMTHSLERFAALVIKPWADQLEVERKKFQELNDVAALGMQHARADEREACAKLCESHVRHPSRLYFAEAIRARGTHER